MPKSRVVQLEFKFPIPSKKNSKEIRTRTSKGKSGVKGKARFITSSNSFKNWEGDEFTRIMALGIEPMRPPVKIEYRVYPPNRERHDLDNAIAGINDLLVRCKIIPDDDWFTVCAVDARAIAIDKENARIEVFIGELEKANE